MIHSMVKSWCTFGNNQPYFKVELDWQTVNFSSRKKSTGSAFSIFLVKILNTVKGNFLSSNLRLWYNKMHST